MRYLQHLIFILVLIFPLTGYSQSIYSSVGPGDITLPSTVRTAGMGVSGVALTDLRQISLINPALWYKPNLTGMSTKILSGQYKNADGGLTNRLAFDGFTFHFPVGTSAGVALGFAPYSNVGYNFRRTSQEIIPGVHSADTLNYSLKTTGSGGIGGTFLGFGIQFSRRIAFGAAINMLIGEINVDHNMVISHPTTYSSREVLRQSNIFGSTLILGGTFSQIAQSTDNFGIRVEIPLSLTVNQENKFYTGISSAEVVTDAKDGLSWPFQMGVGYSFQLRPQWTTVFETNIWSPGSNLNIFSPGQNQYTLGNGYELGIGLEYTGDVNSNQWWNRLAYRTGLQWQQYLVESETGNHPAGMRWLGGIGLPYGQGANRLDLAVYYGQRSGVKPGDPVEKQIGFQIGISVSELWFQGGIRNNY